ncbi:Sugar phosphate permease [Paenibacillus sp. UNCCL117]|uniref:MFS transporter n=1 Tax=unclassified Paenibacillus TaxID=185978 RepID=UPI000892412C|nr:MULTISPECIES: MFS transporter [unclassified Paenibacillus]SDD14650.1 Sugar phosphate permease [Paenibacillus sp. cl123]SFW34268.1 Sugar phosphate permease [Paenibacillus sp. UNCCL117]
MWLRERKYAWLLLAVLWVFGCIGALSRFVMAYYQVAITEDFAVGRSFISYAWSLNLLVAALCMPLGGWLVDKYGAKAVMAVSALFGAAGSALIFIVQHPLAFVLGYGLLSGLVGIGATTTYALVFHWFEHHRAKALTILSSASPLGLAIASPVFIHYKGLTWEYAFLATALLGLLLVIPSTLLLVRNPAASGASAPARPDAEATRPTAAEQSAAAEPRLSHPVRRLAGRMLTAASTASSTPVLPMVMLGLFVCGFHMGTVEMNMVAIHQHAQVSDTMVASAISALGLMEIAGSFLFGYMLDRFPRAFILALLYGLRAIGFIVLYVHLELSPLLFSVMFGATYVGAVPGGLLLAREAIRGGGTTQTGFLLLFHQAGGIVGALVAGLLFDRFSSYQPLIGVSIGLAVLTMAGYFAVHVWLRRRSAHPVPANQTRGASAEEAGA